MKKLINDKVNFVFALYLVLMPIIMSLFALFNIDFTIMRQLIAWGIIYFACITILLIFCLLKGNKLNFKFQKNPFTFMALSIFVWILISSIVNKAFNLCWVIYIVYFLIFLCFFYVDKKYIKLLLNILLIVMSISCIMGFIDPHGNFIPGFNNQSASLSLHFVNPNYTGCIIASLTIICFMFFNQAKGILLNLLYCIIYLIFATYLFMNGSFVPITATIIIELFIQLFLGIKNKKFQYKIFLQFAVFILIGILVNLIPNINDIRTCQYSYFLECIAVFDNIFHTKLLRFFGIETMIGADGGDRNILILNSLKYSVSSLKIFLFGSGAGFFYTLRPHNALVSLLLDFGVVVPLFYITFFVLLFIRVLKNNFNYNTLCFLMAIVCFILCYFTGSLIYNSYYVFMIILGILFKNLFANENQK